MDTQSPPLDGTTPGPAPGSPAPESPTPENAGNQLTALPELIKHLSDGLAAVERQIAAGRDSLADATAQQRHFRADLTALQSATEKFTAARDEATAAITEAGAAVTAVHKRIEALPEPQRQELDARVKDIDDGIQEKAAAFTAAQQELSTRQQVAEQADTTLQQRTETFRSALGDIATLADRLRQLVSPLAMLTGDLKATARTDQDRKLYVISADIGVTLKRIEDLIAGDALANLVQAYDAARESLGEARRARAAAATAVAEQDQVVVTRRTEADLARAGRKGALEPLYTAADAGLESKPTTPTEPTTPTTPTTD